MYTLLLCVADSALYHPTLAVFIGDGFKEARGTIAPRGSENLLNFYTNFTDFICIFYLNLKSFVTLSEFCHSFPRLVAGSS